jgi:hypothetical protein
MQSVSDRLGASTKRALPLLGVALLFCLHVNDARAESRLVSGTGNASTRVNVQVVIPRVLYLAIGSGVGGVMQNTAAITEPTWSFITNPAAVGTGAAAGAQASTTFFVRVYGNNGQITLSANNPGVLSNGVHTIPMSQIVPAFSLNVPIPSFGGAPVLVPPNVAGGRITSRTGLWSFNYLNTVAPLSGGTYTAQVTYTATMP